MIRNLISILIFMLIGIPSYSQSQEKLQVIYPNGERIEIVLYEADLKQIDSDPKFLFDVLKRENIYCTNPELVSDCILLCPETGVKIRVANCSEKMKKNLISLTNN